jgi:hypothetical protein
MFRRSGRRFADKDMRQNKMSPSRGAGVEQSAPPCYKAAAPP